MNKKELRKILIVVDMQNEFVNGALGSNEAKQIISNVKDKIIDVSKEENTAIIFTRDTHDEDYMNTEEGKNLPVPHCIKGEHGWELVDEIKELSLTIGKIIDKDTFGSRELGTYLLTLEGEFHIEEIEFVGLCTDICVISNAVIAKTFCPNIHLVVDAACCAGVTPESHDIALEAMSSLQVEVRNRGKEPWRK